MRVTPKKMRQVKITDLMVSLCATITKEIRAKKPDIEFLDEIFAELETLNNVWKDARGK